MADTDNLSHKKRGPEEGDSCPAKQPRLSADANASGGSPVGTSKADAHRSPDGPGSSSSGVALFTPLTAAYSEDKGCRSTMEDVCVLQLDARREPSAACRLAHFGIFDGHGGLSCASFAAQHLHARVLEAGLLRKGLQGGKADAKACKASIAEGFKTTDEALLKECASKNWQDGACAVAVWVLQDLVCVANVGDAKCVLARMPDKPSSSNPVASSAAQPQPPQTSPAAAAAGASVPAPASKPKAIVLTKEHTALLERQRIEKAGGSVVNGRLAGRIQIARSFGDAAFKKLGCSSTPDVTAFPLTRRDSFLLLGCDGFWGVFGAQEAVDTAAALLGEGQAVKAVTNRLLNIAVREKRCKDNCSVLLVRFGGSEGAGGAAGGAGAGAGS
ncbi:hypothetical protein Agub_g6356 [Astrephomene gubernaculifera]|uniref:PPM-type phosphatase domain-containing protein n=1 Tax=Astrephomene gubernaculifera TaxID=47775 RepID=A0AAD3DNS8_9CHLO|nr:hypothetical protein Agub_g6356 [Astrephomene gubernaculifera]